jgi:isoquinoline 1-oxidoreductase beta subunit
MRVSGIQGTPEPAGAGGGSGTGDGVSRRRFIGYLIAGPVLVAGARMAIDPSPAAAAVPTIQLPVDEFDLSDLLTLSSDPTNGFLTVQVNHDGTAGFALPRAEVGQGLTTSFAMIIADEIGLPLDQVTVTLRDADPLLIYNQLTGGSNSTHSLYTPVRTAAATARTQLTKAAAAKLGGRGADYDIVDGVIRGRGGTISVAEVAPDAAVSRNQIVKASLRPRSTGLVGSAQKRVDAHEIVTGTKQFTLDVDVPGALPTMVCRPPTINGKAVSIKNRSAVLAMPGITDVVIIPHTSYVPGGVAVRGETFGQCIDAIRALDVVWAGGPVEGRSDADVLADLHRAELPLLPTVPGTKTLDETFTFHFRPGDPLETNCAIADVRHDGTAEIWSSLKSPIWAKEQIATNLGLAFHDVVVHVTQGGGSFGRHLFCDAAFEASSISRAIGKPVKLMWSRTDNFRQGRVHPMCLSRVRMSYTGKSVLTYEQRHTSVATDFSQGFGDILSALADEIPIGGNYSVAQGIFILTASVPYNFGVVDQLLNEIYSYNTFNTSSVRNIYSPDVCTATELMVDALGKELGMDPLQVRRTFVRDARMRAVLDKLAQVGNWGRAMPAGTAQGIGIHNEYKSRGACLVEIDTRPQTTNRKIKDAFTGPRVTKMLTVVDVGTPINTLGLEAQMMGGMMDGLAQALTYSLHLKDGYYLEGSWDNAYYTRQWNAPPELEVVVMPANGNPPGGAGELGVAPAMAAVASAYARATGKMPTSFPINHDQPLGFTPYPTVPPVPQSPTNGLRLAGKPTTVD